METRFAGGVFVECEFFQGGAQFGGPGAGEIAPSHSLSQNALCGFAEEDVSTAELRNEVVIALGRQIKAWCARFVAIAETVQTSFKPIHTIGVTRGILRAMIPV